MLQRFLINMFVKMAIVVGVFRLCIDLPEDKVQNCYLNPERLDSFDERIFRKLQQGAGNNKLLHVPVGKIPAYKKFFQFWEDHEVEIDLTDSVAFQTTCKFFELDELEHKVKSNFGADRKKFLIFSILYSYMYIYSISYRLYDIFYIERT